MAENGSNKLIRRFERTTLVRKNGSNAFEHRRQHAKILEKSALSVRELSRHSRYYKERRYKNPADIPGPDKGSLRAVPKKPLEVAVKLWQGSIRIIEILGGKIIVKPGMASRTSLTMYPVRRGRSAVRSKAEGKAAQPTNRFEGEHSAPKFGKPSESLVGNGKTFRS